MAIKDCWLWNGKRASELFGFVKETEAGKAMKEISDIWQPMADDIHAWKTIQDIGKFSDETMVELKEAWAVIPEKQKKILKDVLKKLQKVCSPAVLMQIIELYLKSVKA